MRRLFRRGLSVIFLGLAVIGSKAHVIVHRVLDLAERANLGQWKRGLLFTLQLYDKFRNGKNGKGNDTDTD